MKYTTLMSAVALTLLASASSAWADPMTDQALVASQDGYSAQQSAIKALNDTGHHRVASYSLAKAQCWLDVSKHEYERNDRSAFPRQALDQSRLITDFLAAGGEETHPLNPAHSTPLINGAPKLRADLWQRFAALKIAPGFRCAARLTACGEVELVHAGNEFAQWDWRAAQPYVQISEDNEGEASAAADACIPPPASPVVVAPVAPPAASVATIVLGANVLFKFDKRSTADMLPAGRAQLDDVAARLTAAYSRIDKIDVVGYTDRLGSTPYNAKLSKDRADTVARYLNAHGVPDVIVTEGRGKADPLSHCDGHLARSDLEACLQVDRRVELTIRGVTKSQ